MKRVLATLLLISFYCEINKAQELGEYPNSIHWNQINTDTVRIIFPDGMEKYAQRICNLTTEEQQKHNFSIGFKHRKLDIVLRNQSIIPNAYVGLGPFRSEYYTTPPSQNERLGTLPWLDLLSIHEYRHAMQFSNAKQGFSKFAYFLFGDYGLAITSNLSVPNWFWEGDAVCNETALTQQGRGRMPSFYLGFKTLEQNNTRYSYMKVRNGSFKDYVPNHYELGYLMCSYARNNYNNSVWNNVFRNGVSYNSILYPFSRALKRNAGLTTRALYQKSFDSYAAEWQKQQNTTQFTPTTPLLINKKNTVYTNHLYPTLDENGNVICLKKSFNKPSTFVRIDKQGKEKSLFLAGLTVDDIFSYAQNNIAWIQYHTDIRWSGFVYTDIVLYNCSTKTKRTITAKGKYFSPNLSPAKPEVVATYNNMPDINKIVILNTETGNIIKEIGSKLNYFFTNPVFDIKGESIITAVRNQKGQIALAKINIDTEAIDILTPFSYNTLGRASCTSQGIYFTASYSGINNLYIIDNQNNIKQISSVKTGVNSAAIDTTNQTIALSVYQKNGYKIEYLPVKESLNKSVSITEPIDQPYYLTQYAKAEGGDILSNVPLKQREVTSYDKGDHMFRIHSWMLNANGQNNGLLFYTQNTLNTLTGTAGFIYNKNEERTYFMGDLLYSIGYPVLHVGATTTFDESSTNTDAVDKYYFNKQNYTAGLQLPLKLSRGNYYRGITTEAGIVYNQINVSNKYILPKDYAQGYYGQISILNQKLKAYQNLYSPFGQSIIVSYKESNNGLSTKLFRADGFFSFKGLFPNHNLTIQANYGKQNFETSLFTFTDEFPHSPGYKSYSLYSDIKRVEASYHLPLCYPDFGIGGIIYFNRIQLAGYYNYSEMNSKTFDHMQLNTTGGEITFDTKIFNVLSTSWGFRYNYRLNKTIDSFEGNNIDFFLAIDTF